jgi:hypothetical protein
MGCALTSGRLNIRYLGSEFTEKIIPLIVAASVLGGVILKILAHQVIQSLVKWKRKRKEKLKPTIVPAGTGSVSDPKTIAYGIETHNGLYSFKKNLLSFCMCFCCKKKIRKTEYDFL